MNWLIVFKKIFKLVDIFLFEICGIVYIRIFEYLGKSQISKNIFIRSIGYLPSRLSALFGLQPIRLSAYIYSRSKYKKKKTNKRIKNVELRSYLYIATSTSEKESHSLIDPKRFRTLLEKERLDAQRQYALGHQLFGVGRLNLACETFVDLIENAFKGLPLKLRLKLYRDCGTAHFMYGRNDMAQKYWMLAGQLRRFILGPQDNNIYRIIGNSWFAAIGHVAMLDFYLKYIKLFRHSSSRTVIQHDISTVPGGYLLNKFKGKHIVLLDKNGSDTLEQDYNRWAKENGKLSWAQLTTAEQEAHIDDFWEFEFPDGQILGYTHAAARIQQEWERRKLSPLLSVSGEEQAFVHHILEILGVPNDAWYICLHVREPGFHQQWNELYPSMRDAEIEDYMLAIDKIVKNGGWVLRMGDPTMKKLPEIKGVIDYAHSTHKTTTADMLIPLCSRFILGTNSGYATIPSIYGVRCAFTNWVPIGLPLWPSRDMMIPKLFWDREAERYLNLEEIFETGLAFVQNWADLPQGISLVKNTPQDISELAEEMLKMTETDTNSEKNREMALFHRAYRKIAENHGSYVGSHIGCTFIKKYPAVFDVFSENQHKPSKPQTFNSEVIYGQNC